MWLIFVEKLIKLIKVKSKKETLYKILILGDGSVGKTSFLTRYADNSFQESVLSTIGVDYKLKNVQLDDGRTVKLQIWDTAGQDRFRSIAKNYYKGANGIVVVFSVIDKESFKNVRTWISQIKEEVDEKVTIILVGNKIDREDARVVSKEKGEELAKEFGLPFFECSAKTGVNITTAFNELVKRVVEISDKYGGKEGEKLKQNKVAFKQRECCLD